MREVEKSWLFDLLLLVLVRWVHCTRIEVRGIERDKWDETSDREMVRTLICEEQARHSPKERRASSSLERMESMRSWAGAA